LKKPLIITGTGDRPQPKPRIIRPNNILIIKYYLYVLLLFIVITSFIVGFGSIIAIFDDDPLPDFLIYMFIFYLMVWLVIGILSLILIPIYVKSFEYVVHGTEVVVRKGIINITEKHVPYRTVTNIDSVAGILDRLFGIGNIDIQTAGGASSSGYGPEEKLEGLTIYNEIRDYIVLQLRQFKHGSSSKSSSASLESNEIKKKLQNDILEELRQIKKELN
jgi:membrane protein YdbS with pleckstrin-like domain